MKITMYDASNNGYGLWTWQIFQTLQLNVETDFIVSSYHKLKAVPLGSSRAGIYTHVQPNPKSMLFTVLFIFKFKDQASVYISIHEAHCAC